MNQAKAKLARFKVTIAQIKKEIKRLEKETAHFMLELDLLMKEFGSNSTEYKEAVKGVVALEVDLNEKRATLKNFEALIKGVGR